MNAFDVTTKLAAFTSDYFGSNSVQFYVNTSAGIKINKQTTASGLTADTEYVETLNVYAERQWLESGFAFVSEQGQTPHKQIRLEYHAEDEEGAASLRWGCSNNVAEQPSDIDAIRLADALHRHFETFSFDQLMKVVLPRAEKAALQYHESVLRSLESATARLGTALADQAKVNADHLNKLTTELENKFQERTDALDKRAAAREGELAAREAGFKKERDTFDLRENTAVRRTLLDDQKAYIAENKVLRVSPTTTAKREIIHHVCIIAMLGGITLAGVFGYGLFKSAAFDWHLLAPFSAGLILFGSTLIFYLKWNNRWFEDHAHAEFYFRKLNSDILRASWIAELFFEWKDKKDIGIPHEVLTSFTRNLFVDTTVNTVSDHPFDQLLLTFVL